MKEEKTHGYIGEYTTDGSNCNCSWFVAKHKSKSFVSGDHIEELPEVANESVDLFASIIDDPSSVGPASPGIDNTRK